jgi:hypothetical protein
LPTNPGLFPVRSLILFLVINFLSGESQVIITPKYQYSHWSFTIPMDRKKADLIP